MSLSFSKGLLSNEAIKKLTDELYHENWRVRVRANRLLSRFGDQRAVEPVLKALNDPAVLGIALIKTANELAGTAVIEPFRNLLPVVKQPELRLHIMMVLNQYGQLEDYQELAPLLKKTDAETQASFMNTLAASGNPQAKEVLVQIEAEHPDITIRQAAQKALAEFGNQPDKEALAKILVSGSWPDRAGAAVKLYQLGDERGFNYLVKRVQHMEMVGAVKQLVQLNDPRTNAVLLEALDQENPLLLKEASEALGDLGEQRAVEPLLKLLATSYYDEDDHEFDELEEDDENYIQTNEIEARVAAARALLKLDPQKALPAIQQVMRREEEPAVLRSELALLAHQRGDNEAIEIVQKLLIRSYIREDTIDTITEIAEHFEETTPNEEPLPEKPIRADTLLENLKTEQASQHQTTLEALGELGDTTAIEPVKSWLGQLSPSLYNYDLLVATAKLTLIELGTETAPLDLKTLLREITQRWEKEPRYSGLVEVSKRAITTLAKIADYETIPILENLLLTGLSTNGTTAIVLENFLAQTIYQLKQAKKN